MSQLWVVDASALLATIKAEPGSDFVEERNSRDSTYSKTPVGV